MTPLAAWTMEKAGQVADTGLGMLLGGLQDKRQRRQQQKLQDMQIAGNKQMIDYQMQKQLEMWKNTNYSAQVGELEKAGLNSGLIYGMSGGGGTTTGNTSGGVTGASAAGHSGEPQAMMGLGIQRGMMQAQLDLIKAQTEKTKAEAVKTAGVDTELGQTQIQSLTQGVQNQKAVEALTRVQTRIANIEEEIKGATAEDSINYVAWQTGKALYEMEMTERNNWIDKATMNDKIDMVKAELFGKWLENAMTQQNTAKSAQETELIKKEVQTFFERMYREKEMNWRKITNDRQNADANTKNAATNEFVHDMAESTKVPIDLIEKAVQAILLKNILKPGAPTPVKGFRQ